MEEYYYLIDIITDLIENGYSLNFSDFEDTFKVLNDEKNVKLLPKDFKIDRIYKCRESVYGSCSIFVFAVSSSHYKFKGILVNGLEERKESSFLEKFRNMLQRMGKRKSPNHG